MAPHRCAAYGTILALCRGASEGVASLDRLRVGQGEHLLPSLAVVVLGNGQGHCLRGGGGAQQPAGSLMACFVARWQ